MPYPYKLVTSGDKELGRIAGNAGAHAQLITDDLTARWRHKMQKGQKSLTVLQLQIFVREELLELREKIRKVEKEHMEELEADIESRLKRDENRPLVRERLIQILGLVESTYGGGSSRKIFGPGVTTIPVDAVALVRVGLVARERLKSPGLNLGKPRYGGVDIDPLALAASFEKPLLRLDKVLARLEATLPRTNQSLERKMRTLEALNRRALVSGQFLVALYVLAEHEELAKRVRPSSRSSRRRRIAGGGEGGAPGGAPGTPPAPDDAAAPASPGEAAEFPFEPASPATTEGRPAQPAG